MRILIVEGNSTPILAEERENGFQLAWEQYRDAIALHAPDAEFAASFPFAPQEDGTRESPDAFDAFVLTGSGVPWGAEAPETRPYLDHIEPMLASGKPVLGSCWGMQTVAVLLGGMSGINPAGSEIGLARNITLTEAGMQHPLFAGMGTVFDSPAWHRDHVNRLPDGAVCLAGNEISQYQAMAYQTAGVDYLGFQFHPENALETFRAYFAKRSPQPGTVRELVDFPDEVPDEVSDPMRRTMAIGNWIGHVRNRLDRTA